MTKPLKTADVSPLPSTPTITLPYLLTLVVQLKLYIISYLPEEGHDLASGRSCPYPSLMTLRRLHRAIRALVPYDRSCSALDY